MYNKRDQRHRDVTENLVTLIQVERDSPSMKTFCPVFPVTRYTQQNLSSLEHQRRLSSRGRTASALSRGCEKKAEIRLEALVCSDDQHRQRVFFISAVQSDTLEVAPDVYVYTSFLVCSRPSD